MKISHLKEELNGGKLRVKKWCAHCNREVWGVFMWREDQGVFTCDHGHKTAYECAQWGWGPCEAAAA